MSEDSINDKWPELKKFPESVEKNFISSLSEMPDALSESQIRDWYQQGISLASQTVRSWESAAHFFAVSPAVLKSMPYSYFEKWMECGEKLCNESPTLASAYFESSPGTMSQLRSRHIEEWASLGDQLYKGTWKSSTLACRFFVLSPILLSQLSFNQLQTFSQFLDKLAHRSYDLALESLSVEHYFSFSSKVLSWFF